MLSDNFLAGFLFLIFPFNKMSRNRDKRDMKAVAQKAHPVLGELRDDDLLDLALAGNEGAWREIVRRYHGKVSATVYRIYGAKAETEDIVQEIFIEVAKSAKNFRRDSSFSTFLYRLAVNTAYRYIKRHKEPHLVSGIDEMLETMTLPAMEQHSPVEEIIATENRSQVLAALAQLSVEKRMALVLFEMEGLTLREIAGILKVPLQTVWSRVYSGRKEMARLLTHPHGGAS